MKKKVIYFSLLILAIIFVSTAYYSYAFFTNQVEGHGKLNIVAGTLDYQIESKDLENNQIFLNSYETKILMVTMTSLNEIDSKYELYYLLNDGVEVGYLEESQDPVIGEIASNQKKNIKIVAINHTNQSQTITLGVEGGFLKNNLILSKGNHILKLSPYNATNMIVNGGLEKEDTGIGTRPYSFQRKKSNSLVYEGNYSLEVSYPGEWEYKETIEAVEAQPEIKQNHKYYATEMVNPTKMNLSNSWMGDFDMYRVGGTTNEYPEYGNMYLPSLLKTNTWQKLSFTFTSSVTHQYNFRLMYIQTSGTVDFQAYFDNMMFIDLTETFGSGNEPDKNWCDSHIHYFDDTTVVYK